MNNEQNTSVAFVVCLYFFGDVGNKEWKQYAILSLKNRILIIIIWQFFFVSTNTVTNTDTIVNKLKSSWAVEIK